MLKTEQNNPIYDRLTRNTRGPSKRLLPWLAVGIGTAALVVAIILLNYNVRLAVLIPALSAIINIISPVVIAVYAANLASKDLNQENLQMMKLAGITDGVMINGYARAAFHRLRLLAAVTTSLVPALLIGSSLAIVSWMNTSLPDVGLTEMALFQLVLLPTVMLSSVGAWFFQKFGSACGASFAVWWKHPILAMIAGGLATLIMEPVVLNAAFNVFTESIRTVSFILSVLEELGIEVLT